MLTRRFVRERWAPPMFRLLVTNKTPERGLGLSTPKFPNEDQIRGTRSGYAGFSATVRVVCGSFDKASTYAAISDESCIRTDPSTRASALPPALAVTTGHPHCCASSRA